MTAPYSAPRFVVDRFEGDLAVLVNDDGLSKDVPRRLLAQDVGEGDVVTQKGNVWMRDAQETRTRLDEVGRVLTGLRKRDPGGDIKL
jgi:hypothetical protein